MHANIRRVYAFILILNKLTNKKRRDQAKRCHGLLLLLCRPAQYADTHQCGPRHMDDHTRHTELLPGGSSPMLRPCNGRYQSVGCLLWHLLVVWPGLLRQIVDRLASHHLYHLSDGCHSRRHCFGCSSHHILRMGIFYTETSPSFFFPHSFIPKIHVMHNSISFSYLMCFCTFVRIKREFRQAPIFTFYKMNN